MKGTRDIAAVGLLLALSATAALAIEQRLTAALDDVRGTRTVLLARSALADGRPEGALTIVAETASAKYPFLNKRSYAVHTSSAARERTVLSGDDPSDKARADRHSEVRRTGKPLILRLEDGSFRATVGEGLRSAELVVPSVPVDRPSPLTGCLAAAFAALIVGGVLRLRLSGFVAWTAAAVILCVGIVLAAQSALQESSSVATSFLREGFERAPSVDLPALPILATAIAIGLVGTLLIAAWTSNVGARLARTLVRDRYAYTALAPALFGMALLVGIPFVFGIGLSLFHHEHGRFTFVGLRNFVEIMSSSDEAFFRPRTLPYSLVVTVLWTLVNVTLHTGLGLALALLLRPRSGVLSRLYRVILIVPWAVPSYLTALIWRSLFDADIGVINRILGLEGMSWMHDPLTAFAANLVTNVWLGVPFMMVVCLGALTSIPQDLYEAAEVDGASRFEQLVHITLPLLKPALLPAVLIGSVWTFNKFEVIYLVSEGRPDGATDILVTEAYRWAFERGLAQGGAYGYAAAYSVIIFAVLLLYGWMTARVSKRAEEALR